MKHAPLLLILIAGLMAASALWWFGGDSDPSTDSFAPPAVLPGISAAGPDDPATLVADAVDPGGSPSAPGAAGPASSRASLADEHDAHPEESVWIEGRVDLASGCEGDETLEVFALGHDLDYGWLADALERADRDDSHRGLDDSVYARRSVEADGSFRLPFPADKDEGFLLLRGRFLYLAEALSVDLADDTAPVIIDPDRGAWVRGRLVPPTTEEIADGEVDPLEGVRLRLRTDVTEINPMMPNSGVVAANVSTTSGPGGAFEIRAVPADNEYIFSVRHDRFAAVRETLSGFESCTERTLEVDLRHGGTLRGRVLDALGKPIAGAEVSAALPGRWFGFDDYTVRDGETDASGSFELLGVAPGMVNVRASKDGRLDSDKVKVEVIDGQSVDGLALELGEGNSLAGRVEWPDGRPAANVPVDVDFDTAHMAGPSAFNALRGAEGEGETGTDGRFVVTGLGAGPFVVEVEAEVGIDGVPVPPSVTLELADWDEDEDDEGEKTTVNYRARMDGISPGKEDLLLVLRPPLGLWGRVVDTAGDPVTAFEVKATRVVEGAFGEVFNTSSHDDFESDEGRFFLDDLIEGRWKVEVEGDGYVTLEPITIELPADTENDPLLIEVLRTCKVSGVVFAPTGDPVTGAEVTIDTGAPAWQAMMSGRELPTAISEEGGAFVLEGIPPQPLGLVAQDADYARSAPVSLELVPGEEYPDITLVLTLGGDLTGEVFGNDGKRARGQMITITQMKTFDNRIATTDEKGEFLFEHLEPGTWQVVAMDRGADWGSGSEEGFEVTDMMDSMELSQADIVEGETTHVVLGAPPEDPVLVHGKVTHAGEPYRGAMVSFFPEGSKLYERMQFATVDDAGEYELTLDGPGNYVVSVATMPGGAGQQSTIEYASEVPEKSEHRIDFQIPLGRISGQVIGPDGDSASAARITLTQAGGVRSDQFFGGQYTEIPTDANGRYDIKGLRPGRYRLSAGGASFMNLGGGSRFGRVTQGNLKLDEDEWIQDMDFRLPAPGSISVDVVDVSGSPAVGADIFVRDSAGNVVEPFSFNTTDSSGRAKYEGLAPDEYTVSARVGTGASVESEPVRVREGETSSVELQLEEGSILWIVVKDGDGEPIKATLRVTDADGREMVGMFGMQDLQSLYLDGGFSATEHRLGPLPPGRYRVFAEGGGSSASKPVTVRGNGERKVTLRLKK